MHRALQRGGMMNFIIIHLAVSTSITAAKKAQEDDYEWL